MLFVTLLPLFMNTQINMQRDLRVPAQQLYNTRIVSLSVEYRLEHLGGADQLLAAALVTLSVLLLGKCIVMRCIGTATGAATRHPGAYTATAVAIPYFKLYNLHTYIYIYMILISVYYIIYIYIYSFNNIINI